MAAFVGALFGKALPFLVKGGGHLLKYGGKALDVAAALPYLYAMGRPLMNIGSSIISGIKDGAKAVWNNTFGRIGRV